jgi:site-specific DNA recombinase
MGTLNGLRFAVYARFSSDRQSDASIEDQVHRARAFIAAQAGTLDPAMVFADFAVSGASMDRPGMRSSGGDTRQQVRRSRDRVR